MQTISDADLHVRSHPAKIYAVSDMPILAQMSCALLFTMTQRQKLRCPGPRPASRGLQTRAAEVDTSRQVKGASLAHHHVQSQRKCIASTQALPEASLRLAALHLRTFPAAAALLGRRHRGVLQVLRQALQVAGARRPRQRLVVLQQRQVARVRLEVRRQPLAVEQLQPQLLRARLRGLVYDRVQYKG
jgi:hypothetical protein